jgi:malonyl CoA-acyl carrier protein transacylase
VGFIAGQGVELVVEVGPGRVLSGLAKRVPGLRVANVEDLASAQALVGEMGGQA